MSTTSDADEVYPPPVVVTPDPGLISPLTAGANPAVNFSVHNQPDFERVYDEDDTIEVRRGDLRALLDLATGSMDFGSGFWDEEQAEIARKIAGVLDVDPVLVTPPNMVCKYKGEHVWQDVSNSPLLIWRGATKYCVFCSHTDLDRP